MPTYTERLDAEKRAQGSGSHTPPAQQPSALARFLGPVLPSETLSDYWKGPAYAVRHPIDAAKLLAGAVKSDPVGAVPVVGNAKRGWADLKSGNLAGAAGEGTAALLAMLGMKGAGIGEGVGGGLADAAASAARGVGDAVSGPLGAMGRGVEGLGRTMKPLSGPAAVVEGLAGNPVKAMAGLVGPSAAELTGKAMQGLAEKLGGAPSDEIVHNIVPENNRGWQSTEVPYRMDSRLSGLPPEDPLAPQNFQPTPNDVMTGADQYHSGEYDTPTIERPAADNYTAEKTANEYQPPAKYAGPMGRPAGTRAPVLSDALQGVLESLKGDIETSSTALPNDHPAVAGSAGGSAGGSGDWVNDWMDESSRPKGFDMDGTHYEPNDIGSHVATPVPGTTDALDSRISGLSPAVDVSGPEMPASLAALQPSDDGMAMPYTDWASGMDHIINEAAADGSADAEFGKGKQWSKKDYARHGYTPGISLPFSIAEGYGR